MAAAAAATDGDVDIVNQADAPAPVQAPIAKIRRRLSVQADNELIEGVEDMTLKDRSASLPGDVVRTDDIVRSINGQSKKGYAPYNPRKKNQDVLVIEKDEATNSLFLCVMDGHGEQGHLVSQSFKRDIPPALFSHPQWASDPNTSLQEVVLGLEATMNGPSSRIDTQFSGTTYTSAVIRDGVIYCANIGDSRVTIATEVGGQLVAKALTDDHKPDLPEEKARIVAKGGRVFAVRYDDGIDGPPRVWLGHMDVPGLAMSRSLGDKIAHDAGVSSEPAFTQHTLTADDKMLLLASDGLWEFMTDQECVDLAHKFADETTMVEKLVEEANNRWMREEQVIDDTTVVVALLNDYKQ